MTDQEIKIERLKAFFGVWYASERLDSISDFVHKSEKQKIKNIAREFFRIESRTFNAIKPDGDMSTQIILTNQIFDKVIELIESKELDKVQELFNLLGMDYDVL